MPSPVLSVMSHRQAQFDALVRTWSGDLFRYAVWLCGESELARDLVQESFLRAWRSLDDLRDAGAAKAWLITILRREHARIYERVRPDFAELEEIDRQAEPDSPLEDANDLHQLRMAIAELDPKYREPLVLQVLGGLSCEEIAQTLSITPSAVMTQVFRARQKLKARLSGADSESNVHELS